MARVSVVVHVRDATREGLRRVRNSINGLNRGILRTLGDTFSDGIGQAIAGGFRSAMNNPYVAAAVVALVATIATLLGAALAGALTLAFGGAFVALGVMAVKNSKKVKDAFSKEFASLKKEFAGAAEPLIPVLERAAKKMGDLGRAFAPHFKQAMEDAAPFLNDFLDNLESGIKKFGETAFKPMMTAFNELLSAFGPQLEDFLQSLGDAFNELAIVVITYKDEIALAMRIVLELIPLAIRLIATLAATWGTVVRAVQIVIGWLSTLWGWITRNWRLLINISGIGLILYTIQVVRDLWGWVSRNWRLLINVSGIGLILYTIKVVRDLWGWVRRNWRILIQLGGIGAILTAIKHVRTLWGWVSRSWSRNINFNFTVSGALGTIKRLLGMAHGGVRGISAAATGGVRNNLTMVGEHGPELVNLAPGSRVRSNPDTRRILRQGADSGGSTLVFKSSGRRVDDLLIEILREAIHQRGGDPVAVLGG